MPDRPDMSGLGSLGDVRAEKLWSPDELRQRIESREAAFRDMEVPEGAVVQIETDDALKLVTSLFATWGTRAVFACVAPTTRELQRRDLRERLDPYLVITEGEDRIRGGARRMEGGGLVLFTSGTTGKPKLVWLEQKALRTRLEANWREIPFEDMRRSLCLLQPHFGHGLIGNLLTPLLKGSELHLWPKPSIKEIMELPRVIESLDIDFLSSVPTIWSLVRLLKIRPPEKALKRIHIGSAPLAPDLRDFIRDWSGAEVLDIFGMTECSNWIASGTDGHFNRLWDGEIAVLADGTLAPLGEGELLIRSDATMSGYIDDPEATAEAFHDGWLRTGDIARLEPGGSFQLLGRLKTTINRAGISIQPEGIEAMALRTRFLDGACCFGYPDAEMGEGVALAVVSTGISDRKSLLHKIKNRLRQELMADHMPDRWFVLDEIPLTERGKIDRLAVRDLCFPPAGAKRADAH